MIHKFFPGLEDWWFRFCTKLYVGWRVFVLWCFK